MKKVLLSVLVVLLAISITGLVGCASLEVKDTKAPDTTLKPVVTQPQTTVDSTTAGPTVVDPTLDGKYHLETLVADDVAEGDFVFDIYENGAALVGYTGSEAEVKVPEKVNNVAVTLVDDAAFKGAIKMVSVTLPEGVLCIGKDAFYNCRALVSVTLPSTLETVEAYAFSYCQALESIDLPDSVKAIGIASFYNCKSLKTVELSAAMTAVPKKAFAHCSSLEKIELGEAIVSIESEAFYFCESLKEAKLPAKLGVLGTYAFANCYELLEIVIPGGISTVGDYVFYNCKSATGADLGNATSIGAYAFFGCDGLVSYEVSSKVTSVGEGAFANCKNLVSVTLPESITSIPNLLFNKCTSLKSVTFLGEVTKLGNSAFAGTAIESFKFASTLGSTGKNTFEGCDKLSSIEFEEGGKLSILDQEVFLNCTALETVVLPEYVTQLGASVFSGCTSLREVTLSSSLKKIGKEAFLNCPMLESLYVPDTVTDVGKNSLGMLDKVSVDESGKEVVERVVNENFVIEGFSNGMVNNYAASNGIAFESVGLTGCVPFKDLVYEEIDLGDGKVGYEVKDYIGSGTELNLPSNKDGVFFVKLGDGLFEGNTIITKVTIPGSFTYIGKNAFAGCTSITELNFGTTDQNITIGEGAFTGLAIKTVTLPNGVRVLPEKLFYGCAQLESVKLSPDYTEIGASAFEGTALTAIDIPDTVTKIGANALKGTAVAELTLPFIGGSVDSDETFGYIFGGEVPETLKKVTITSVATKVPANAFKDCAYIETVKLGANIASIGDYAFAGCTSLKGEIELEGPAPTIEEGATHILDGVNALVYFKYTTKNTDSYEIVTDENGFNLWNGYRAASSNSKAYYEGVVGEGENEVKIKITFAGVLTAIGEGEIPSYTKDALPVWLTNPDAITSIKFTKVTAIGDYAFYGCNGIKTVTIVSSVASIGEYAFADCENLAEVKIENADATVADNAFENTPYANPVEDEGGDESTGGTEGSEG